MFWNLASKMTTCHTVNVHALLLLAILASALFPSTLCCMFQPDASVQCETVGPSLCRPLPGLHFNSTSFPNLYGHRNLAQAQQHLDDAQDLLVSLERLNCSKHAHILVCAAVFPACIEQLFGRVEPCREMCVSVRDSCRAPLQKTSGEEWPNSLNCSLFSPYGTRLCIWNDTNCQLPPVPAPATTKAMAEILTAPNTAPVDVGVGPLCTGRLSSVNNSKARFGGLDQCVEPCQGVYFEEGHTMLITMWTAAISFLSLIVAILVFFTFLLNYKTVQSLEMPLYYLALCYGVLAFTNLLSVAVGKEAVLCDSAVQNPYNQSVLVVDGLTNPVCSVLFSLAYYSTLCTWSWWIVLALEWGLCTLRSRNISVEWKAIFHLLAWGTPVLFLLLAISTRSFSGNSVLQSCWIGKRHEVAFTLIPLSVAIGFCSVLVLVAFPRIVNLQSEKFKKMHIGTTMAEIPNGVDPGLLNRIGTYVAFYLLPMGLLFCTYFYDYWYREAWEVSYLACSTSSASLQGCKAVPSYRKPLVQVYMAQVLASVCMGFLTVFWLLRRRLLLAWKNLCCAACDYGVKQYGKKPQAPVRLQMDPVRIQMQDSTVVGSSEV